MDSSKKPDAEHPRDSAGTFSQLFFIWAIRLLYKGSKKGLSVRDLTKGRRIDDSQDLGDQLEFYWREEVEKARTKNRKPNFLNVMFKTFWPSFIIDGIIMITFVFIRSSAPLIVSQIVLQFQKPNKNNTLEANATVNENEVIWKNIWNDLNWLCVFLVSAHSLACLLNHHAELRQRLVCARMRIACSSLIYRKMLRLSKGIISKTPIGHIINLISNDVGRFDLGFIYVHYIWIVPLQTVFICYLTWNDFGVASIIGVIVLLFLTVPVQTGISRLSSRLRGEIAEKTDKRLGVMNELLQGIQVIKMYGWEKPFEAIVAETRRLEIKQIRFTTYLWAYFVSAIDFAEKMTLFVTIISLITFGKYATPDLVFGIAQFYSALQLTAAINYPLAMTFGAEAIASIRRVQDFLLLEEHKRNVKGITYHKKNERKDLYSIKINNLFASWDRNDRVTLSDITLNIREGTLCAIIGSVGSGKSSLLHLLLKELPITSGKVDVFGKLSYASQEPWLFAGTVRNNILFSEKYLPQRYYLVTKSCALLTDFSQLPMGDKTFITDKGGLSGGQRARISLARAVYREASIYLFDDPLSAVDTHVGRHLFDEVIGPKSCLAKEKATRILITHQVHFLTVAEWIVIIENGKIVHQGTFDDLANNQEIDMFKYIEKSIENSKTDENNSNNLPLINNNLVISDSPIPMVNVYEKDEEGNQEEQGKGSQRVWRNYLLAGCNSSFLAIAAFVVLLIFSQIILSGTDYYSDIFALQEFNRSNNLPLMLNLFELLVIYSCLIIAVIIITLTRSFLLFKICMRASTELHARMFKNILNATMRFFDINPAGSILNRFSRDLGVIDEFLPRTLLDCIQVSLLIIGILTLVTMMNPYLVGALLIALMLYYMIFRLYLRASLDLKRLESMCKSPVFSHMSASLAGSSTIRSKNLERIVTKEFDGLQNVHSAVWLSTITANAALGLWTDFVSCAFIAAVSYSFTYSTGANSADVGLAVSQSVILASLVQYGLQQIAEAFQWMISVERVLQYNNIDQEPKINNYPPQFWPTYGRIEFNITSLSYDKDLPPTLQNLQFIVQPTWKVGIVGRTGAGKSSLINALFRLSPIEGEIYIDNIETGSISLSHLRSCISIIPQKPILFSETLRYNLDPFKKYWDTDVLQALQDVELKLPLDFVVSEGGTNFSAGEKQLICLARSILRKNKIIVLDEATANVDPQTDALIQKTIRKKFSQCSVLTIAHRLHTIIDSDKVLVMDAGSVAEYDHPHLLLSNPTGIFRNMVDAAGPKDSADLKAMAKENYKQRKL